MADKELGQKALFQVLSVGEKGIAQPHPKACFLSQHAHRSAKPLNAIGNYGADGREDHQRQLFDDQSPKRQLVLVMLRVVNSIKRKVMSIQPHAAQRPVVQEQEYEGRGHQHRFGHQPQGQRHEHRRVAEDGRPPDIAAVGQEGEHEEQRAEDVLAFRDPGDRFNVQGMQPEQRSHQGASPEGPRHQPQRDEQQDRVGRVQCDVDRMVPARPVLDAEEVAVEHVGKHRHRMPVAHCNGSEGIDQALVGQPMADGRVLDDIAMIVQRDEGIGVDRPVDGRHGRHEQETDGQFAPHGELDSGWTANDSLGATRSS